MNSIVQKSDSPFRTRKIFPFYAYLIDHNLSKAIPEDIFSWRYTPSGGTTVISRCKSWESDDLTSGMLASQCEQLLAEHILPVVIVQAVTNSTDWVEKYNVFSERFRDAIQIRLVIDEYDEHFFDLCQELFFPDRAIINLWSKSRIYRGVGLTFWPGSSDINSGFLAEYEKTIRTWLSESHHRIELQDGGYKDFFDDPDRDFDAGEFRQKIQHSANTNGAILSLTLNDFPYIKVEGEIENGRVIACTSTGLFSEAFSQRIIAKAWESTETQRKALNFYPENWKKKADLNLTKQSVDAENLSKSSYRSQDISFTCTKNPRYRLTFRIDPSVQAENAESFVILEVPQYLESKKLALHFDSRYTLNLTLSKESSDETDVYCQPEEGLECNRWVGLLSLNHQQSLDEVADIWGAFTISDTDEG